MRLEERISAFVALGIKIKELNPNALDELQWRAKNGNNWFTEESVVQALHGISYMLESDKVESWTGAYSLSQEFSGLRVGILMAGNIPAVGFHDLMCVLLAGHIASLKLSSSDTVLMKWLISLLIEIDARFEDRIEIQEMLKGKDAYIATGSDNSARYFNYYFGKYPNIIRKNRTSVGVLLGDETVSDYLKLGKDIFQYYGLGCRNVSKIYIKDPAQLQEFLGAIEVFNTVSSHHKYSNNYDYNKSILLVNRENHLDNGFLIVKESISLVSPIAVLFYECYRDEAHLNELLEGNSSKIQCLVSKEAKFNGSIPFGTAQQPGLSDYADGVDTLNFLSQLR
jgi:hypothetical protein